MNELSPTGPHWQRISIAGTASLLLWAMQPGVAEAPIPTAALPKVPACEALDPAYWAPFTDEAEQLLGLTKPQLETTLGLDLGQVAEGHYGMANCTDLPLQTGPQRKTLMVSIRGVGEACVIQLAPPPGGDPSRPITGGVAFCAQLDQAT